MMKKILSWTITAAAVANLFWICYLSIESRDASKWSRTTGEVISSSLVINHLPKFLDFSTDGMRWYGAQVQYEYSVNNGAYISNRVSIHDSDSRNPKDALKVMNKYRHHHQVFVFYNPADPQQSYLEPWNIGDIFIPLMLGAVLAFAGFCRFFDESSNFKRGVDSHLYQGNIYQKQGRLDEALYEYNKIIEISPYIAMGYSNRGSLFLQQKRWDLAIADFNHAIMIDPTDSFLFFNRAKAFLGKGQHDKAWEGMMKAKEMGFTVKPEILEEIKRRF